MATLSVMGNGFMTRTPSILTVGSVNADPVVFVLDGSWDGLTVFAAFRNDTEGVERHVLLGDDLTCTIPWECLTQAGTLNVGLLGLRGSEVVKPTIWMQFGKVVQGVNKEGAEPGEPTETALQQVVAIAQSVRDDADQGKFDGEPGKSPEIRNGTWWVWDIEKQDWVDTGVAASGGGSGGATDYNALTNKPQIGGVELSGNKTAQDLGLQPKGDYATTSSKLANPFSLTFTGAVEATYDGSEEKTVTIPTIAGPAGVSPTVATEEIDGGTRVTFTFKDGSETVDILNGKTPVKGTDYFTEEEIQDVAKQAAALVPGGGGSSLYELAKEIIIEEPVSYVMAFPEYIGRFSEIYVVCEVVNDGEDTGSGKLQVAATYGSSPTELIDNSVYMPKVGQTTKAVYHFDQISSIAFIPAYPDYFSGAAVSHKKNDISVGDLIGNITFYARSGKFGIGSVFQVWGKSV